MDILFPWPVTLKTKLLYNTFDAVLNIGTCIIVGENTDFKVLVSWLGHGSTMYIFIISLNVRMLHYDYGRW